MDVFFADDKYHIPRTCTECGGVMVFKGVGEYHCEDCGAVDYDDYGKVRRYIEGHRGATAVEVESAVGVSQRKIRQMLKDGRFEVTADSRAFLHCEMCGKAIRYGEYCSECEIAMHRKFEAQQRAQLKKSIQGYGFGQKGDDGQKRFNRSGN